MSESQLSRCAHAISEALDPRGTIVVLSGAGLSAESGIPTFRGPGGLWSNPRVARAFTVETLRRRPRESWEVFQRLREILAQADPNPGHRSLAELEAQFSDRARVVVVTQNIDGLHQTAGSRRVIELHGSAQRYYCTWCGSLHSWLPPRPVELPPRCACGGVIRPDVVMFGEPVPESAWQEACAAAAHASVMIVVGTSLLVEPAASLPLLALRRHSLVIEVNPEPTPLSGHASYCFRAFASYALPLLVEELKSITHAKA